MIRYMYIAKTAKPSVETTTTGIGDEGETDARDPWNEGGDWEIVDSPALEGVENLKDDGELNKEAAGEARKSGIRKKAAGSR